MSLSDSVATVKWPNVPACYGWLSLDRRGCWRLKGETVSHGGLLAFINKHYGPTQSGDWVFQNGPQAVFVALDYTPLVLRQQFDGRLTAHTGASVGEVQAAYLDEKGSVLLQTSLGPGLLDDRDLAAFVAACRNEQGHPATDDELSGCMHGDLGVRWHGLPIQAINSRDVPQRFGFQPTPFP